MSSKNAPIGPIAPEHHIADGEEPLLHETAKATVETGVTLELKSLKHRAFELKGLRLALGGKLVLGAGLIVVILELVGFLR